MPRVMIPVEDTESTVVRFAVNSVVEQLAHISGLDFNDFIIMEKGGLSRTRKSGKGEVSLELEYNDQAIVEYTSRYLESEMDAPYYTNEYPEIFRHSDVGLSIRPMYNKSRLELSIKYVNKSYNALQKFMSAIRMNMANNVNVNHHDINYSYAIPKDIIYYLYNVYNTMYASGVFPYTLKEYNDNHFTAGLGVRTSIGGKNKEIVMNCLLKGCLGIFTQLPEQIETSKEEPKSEINFNYVVDYERIHALRMDYQKFIYNRVMDTTVFYKYFKRPMLMTYAETDISRPTVLGTWTYDLEKKRRDMSAPEDIFMINEDRWMPKLKRPTMKILQIVPFQVDTDNPTSVFNLDDIRGNALSDEFIDLIKKYGDKVNELFKFPIMIELFSVDRGETLYPLTVDVNTGDIVTDTPMDFMKRHYVVISVSKDMVWFDVKSLQNNPEDLLEIIKPLEPSITLAKHIDGVKTDYSKPVLYLKNSDIDTNTGETPITGTVTNESLSEVLKKVNRDSTGAPNKWLGGKGPSSVEGYLLPENTKTQIYGNPIFKRKK